MVKNLFLKFFRFTDPNIGEKPTLQNTVIIRCFDDEEVDVFSCYDPA